MPVGNMLFKRRIQLSAFFITAMIEFFIAQTAVFRESRL